MRAIEDGVDQLDRDLIIARATEETPGMDTTASLSLVGQAKAVFHAALAKADRREAATEAALAERRAACAAAYPDFFQY